MKDKDYEEEMEKYENFLLWGRIQKEGEIEKAAEALKDEIREYENRLIWGKDWREVFKEINKEMNMEKLHAIDFGEWLLNADIVEIWCEDGKWLWKSTMFDVDSKYYTTEELYNEFVKSI